ncbi:MAG: 16S rRNA (cytosine(1402)-N(4))-methyltransferase RsmH [Pirellulaceae bacterium]|nr:16S rRNA (cytosine(1402)-N(4))-methyltransferase RsmH [Pirellulaceae bacterium]
MSGDSVHIPILSEEILELLGVSAGKTIVDGTFGGGGHSARFLEAVGEAGKVIGIDRDPEAVARGEQKFGSRLTLVCESYIELPLILQQLEIPSVDGILLDLGLSSDQLADHNRGFSYLATGPLDLRFNPEEGRPASWYLQHMDERKLADLIYQFGEERFSRVIARKICERRRTAPIKTAEELSELVQRCVPRSRGHAIHPATRTFQALRIAVNDEMGTLQKALEHLPDCLKPGGRIAIMSFHSLEDRLVKHAFRNDPRLDVITKKPIQPGEEEVHRNSRSRSAKLRVAERTH